MATAVVEPATKKAKTPYAHTREAFLKVYNTLRDEVVDDALLKGQPADAQAWMREHGPRTNPPANQTARTSKLSAPSPPLAPPPMLDYNVPGGKLNRGMAVYDVIAAIKGKDNLSLDEVFKANALGWCIELLQAFFLVADDIMDGSITRRGQPCWYKVPKVGMIACNDYILLECALYRVLRLHFADHGSYAPLLDLFHEVTYQTAHGQLLDLTTAPPAGAIDLARFTKDAYMRIITYKTAFYTFWLPVACGLLLAGEARPEALDLARGICVDIGQYFQIQDDYLDCYGDPSVIGKVGTDIEDAKCCWMVCTALEEASDEQKEVIKANYGLKDPAAVARVKAVYGELGMAARFEEYEAASYSRLSKLIEEQDLLPAGVFTNLLAKIYKRKK
ncbi:farnesyl diphosphate synthase [Raphidocelis subcapitata]|uniref:Farnesyl diphosphate synthase n=1 Tax=Raphidocelis subcapitata TaxID=307507 RepID=A0A2V0P1A3_9CHLO|nr:farnesyl diphosphate synthase [Raphidocelis subcapitata]|eukprot:GBF93349.1 farnesyl diphosphate synthase [Raphidocelis subcapitata]